ncbi:MAG: BrxA/BrxB family bacilliredoxin [Candidatus Iainarchaeum archaeon]|uniref:BrxA/BrxB family bacilliredoxin n=1 Tax=Candidatus Iainarchaeum sp. TaxID=3101447 RepID=A0A7T9DKW0_9ARCH|nr:MAG: BrxA/BrxB family bacilliredoxin [Candidatus Diapherotrites archaeon]
MYDPAYTAPMQAELQSIGVKPLNTIPEVEQALAQKGTMLLVVNSVCGCGAGCARPAVKLAMQHKPLPMHAVTVFAGVDREATHRARAAIPEFPPSSPSIFLLKDGKCVFALQRSDIEGRDPAALAQKLTAAFDEYCK